MIPATHARRSARSGPSSAGWRAGSQVELAATEALAAEGVVPEEAARACRERASFTVEAVEERERTTGHDVAAFVDVVSDSIGEEGRWIHYGLTSSDVLDTALALQLREAGEIVAAGRARLPRRPGRAASGVRATRSASAAPTGVHAEPTTFGLRLAGFAFEADRNLQRLTRRLRAGRRRQALGRGRDLRLGARRRSRRG